MQAPRTTPAYISLHQPLCFSAQVIDPHTNEYIARLKDEPVFLALAQKVLDYLTRIDDQKNMPKIALRLVEHFYFKVQGRGVHVWAKLPAQLPRWRRGTEQGECFR